MFSLIAVSATAQSQKETSNQSSASSNAIRQDGFFYTNPLLDCEPNFNYLPPFKKEVETYVNNQLEKTKAKRVSVYFRQLNNGYSFGINENWKYAPASLTKVSTMIQVLHEAESDHSILKKELTFSGIVSKKDSSRAMPTRLKSGESYPIVNLLVEMIVRSDNQPVHMLERHFNNSNLWKVPFVNLGVNVKYNAGKNRVMSPKEYSNLFRVLYNASYLNRSSSNVALDLLCRTTFRNGIIAGISDGSIRVANKYGSAFIDESIQLHETAIVYLKGSPYLLSIMTEGDSTSELKGILKGISKIVYDNVEGIENDTHSTHSVSGSYEDKLLSPILDCAEELGEILPLAKKIQNLVLEETENNDIELISVYFRHLNNGRLFSINRDSLFTPASIMKVATMMAVLKEAEKTPSLLDQEVVFDRIRGKTTPSIISEQLVIGKSYTVENLIYRSIAYSDNQAARLIHSKLTNLETLWENLFSDLGIRQWKMKNDQYEGAISIKDISLLFRVLYNSTYLNRKSSEWALNALSYSEFSDGIRGGLKPTSVAALKFGERTTVTNTGQECQLHDCGIVYYEDNPYLLCVMTKGKKMLALSQTIQSISKTIFEEMQTQFPVVDSDSSE
ncbi:class A beta-lactamase-related serine hydrolase [Flavobacteriales bacterium]|nr:class A beta-lactamase-related serine hydrolase [Flavobacteriales bacterium]